MKTKQTTPEVHSSITTYEALALAINNNEAKVEEIEAKIAPELEQKKQLDEQTKELRKELAKVMVNNGRSSIFVGGFWFTKKNNAPTFSVFNKKLALAWARKNDCLSIDMASAKPLLKRAMITPDGFSREDSITVSRTKEKEQE